MKRRPILICAVLFAAGAVSFLPRLAHSHCDTLDGPVVTEAREALEKGDVTPVLKWVMDTDETEVRSTFQQALAVRALGPEAKELADTHFFETLVRLHRAGEGAPYTGLKPAGTDLGPAVAGADRALETGSADAIVKEVTNVVAEGIRHRFATALEKKKHAGESVEAGRAYVADYVEFVHYVERLHETATAPAAHHAAEVAEHVHAE